MRLWGVEEVRQEGIWCQGDYVPTHVSSPGHSAGKYGVLDALPCLPVGAHRRKPPDVVPRCPMVSTWESGITEIHRRITLHTLSTHEIPHCVSADASKVNLQGLTS